MHKFTVNWQGAYNEWRRLGCTKAEFFRNHLRRFVTSSEAPSYKTLGYHFTRIEKERAFHVETKSSEATDGSTSVAGKQPSAPTIRAIGTNLNLAVLTAADIERAEGTHADGRRLPHSRRAPDCRFRETSLPQPFRMRLPNGTLVEFSTTAPETLALQMAASAGGAR